MMFSYFKERYCKLSRLSIASESKAYSTISTLTLSTRRGEIYNYISVLNVTINDSKTQVGEQRSLVVGDSGGERD